MTDHGYNVHFWNHLLATAELLETAGSAEARSMVMEQLSTLCEAFGDCADPVESYEEYVVIKLSQAIHSALLIDEGNAQTPRSLT